MSDEHEYGDRIAAARILYEGTNGMTMTDLAAETELPLRELKSASREQGWRKKLETKHGGATPDAVKASQLVKQQAEAVRSTAVEADNTIAGVISELVPTDMEALLTRHRKEWAVARGMSAEALQLRTSNPAMAFERAKMAKITAETLKLVQDGERKAHGIDSGDSGAGSVVVIDRG